MNREKEVHSPPDYQPPSTYEEEIDLADLVGVLYRRRWLIIVGTLLISAAAIGISFLEEKEYKATTLLEIGQLVKGDDQNVSYQTVEPVAAVKSRLDSIAKIAARDFSSTNAEGDGEENIIPNPDALEITVPEKGSIVEISANVPKESKALSYLSKTNELLIADHNRVFERKQEKLKNSIEELKKKRESIKVTLSEMESKKDEKKREFTESEIEKNNRIQENENDIATLKDEKGLIDENLNLLDERIKRLEGIVESTRDRYNNLLDSKLTADAAAKGVEGVSLMLFNSEAQNLQSYLDDLRKQVSYTIPKEQQELRNELKNIDKNIEKKKSEKKLTKQQLKHLEPDLQNEIKKVKSEIAELESEEKAMDVKIDNTEFELENMIKTKILAEPYFSEGPVAPNKKFFAAAGFAGGLFIMLVLAFGIEFFQANRERITGKPMEKGRGES